MEGFISEFYNSSFLEPTVVFCTKSTTHRTTGRPSAGVHFQLRANKEYAINKHQTLYMLHEHEFKPEEGI